MNGKILWLVLAMFVSSSSFAYTDSVWVKGDYGRAGDLVTVKVRLWYEGGGQDDSMSAFAIPLTWDASICSVEAITIGSAFLTRNWIDASQIDNQGTVGEPPIPKLTLSAHVSDSSECVGRGYRQVGMIDFRVLQGIEPSDSTCLDTLMEAFSPPVHLRFVDKHGTTSYVPSFSTDCIRYAEFRDSLWIVSKQGVNGGLVPVQVWLQYEGGGPRDSLSAFDIPLTWDANVCTVEAITLGPDFHRWTDQSKFDNTGADGPPPVPKIGVSTWYYIGPFSADVERGTHLAATIDFRILSTAEAFDSSCIDTLWTAFVPPIFLGYVDQAGIYTYVPRFSPGCVTVVPCTCGDCNGDGRITVADALYTSGHIYRDGDPPACEGDVNQDGRLSIADAIYLLTYIYRGGPEPCNP